MLKEPEMDGEIYGGNLPSISIANRDESDQIGIAIKYESGSTYRSKHGNHL